MREKEKKKTLLLHTCCAPCSTYVLEHLRGVYQITVFFFNPNITDVIEYRRRRDEQRRLLAIVNADVDGFRHCEGRFSAPKQSMADGHATGDGYGVVMPQIGFCEGGYDPRCFFDNISGHEDSPEGGERCNRCYEMRLGETARMAAAGGFDCFATTLTVSPHKSAAAINRIGSQFPLYLPSDFKKNDGYKRSVELAKEYRLYRQDYCGCENHAAKRRV